MTSLRVRPMAGPLRGSVPVPSDKSIGHRAVMLASLCRGASEVRGFSGGEDNRATLAAFEAMGVGVEHPEPGTLRVRGAGPRGLRAPPGDLDCGNSGTTLRLLAGVLAAQSFQARLVGDSSLSRRPMARIATPLRARGATVEGRPHPSREGEITPPLVVGGLAVGARLAGLEWSLPVASAQVKSALLLSGLFAEGSTELSEPVLSRDHTERMLAALGVAVRAAGSWVRLEPPGEATWPTGFSLTLPGDPSAAAFPLVAAALVPGSRVTARRVSVNPTRTGLFDWLRMVGVPVESVPSGDELHEPVGDLTVAHAGAPTARPLGGELSVRAIDEIPVACAVAARAAGVTELRDVAELRVKESDRIRAMARVLSAFGVGVEEHADGLTVEGRPEGPLRAARVSSEGDHRIAMTAAVLGLLGDGETVVDDVDCIATSFPRFAGTLRALGAEVEVVS